MKSQGIIFKFWKPIFFGVIISATVSILVFKVYNSLSNRIREDKYKEIKSIAELKSQQITLWYSERINEINLITKSPFFSEAADKWSKRPEVDNLRQNLISRFTPLIQQKDYNEIIMFSANGVPLFFIGKNEHPLSSELKRTVESCLESPETIQTTDFYRSEIFGTIYIDFVAPLLNEEGKLISILVFRIDPEEFFYPLINEWPTSSLTAETLILNRDNDSAVVLNNSKLHTDIALKLKLPLTDTALPSVKAVLGNTGISECEDFRGEDVLSFSCKIPSTGWVLVVKVNQAEIFSEIRTLSIAILSNVFLLILLIGSVITVYFYRRQKKIYYNLLQSEKSLLESRSKEQEKQKEIERERDYWLSTFNTIKDPIAIIDKNGKIIKCNKSFSFIFEVSPEDLGNLRCHQILHNTNDHIQGCPLVESGKSLKREEMEYTIDSTTYLIVADPILNDNGEFEGVVHIMYDITAYKNTEEELIFAKQKAEEGSRLKTEFIHNISHEIRTPMNAIVGFSNLLNMPEITEKNKTEFTELINESCNQLLNIVDDIINISSIETKKVALNLSDTDVNLLISSLKSQFGRKAEHKSLKLNIDDSRHLSDLKIITDETKLFQILSNLIGNAIKYTNHGEVDFGYKVDNKMLTFFVRDTGTGISPELHSKIFERFYRIQDPVKPQVSGMGLGLSIAKLYSDMMGGKIWVDSSPGNGSEFFVSIPLSISEYKNHPSQQNEKVNKVNFKDLTIMIAEDEVTNYQLLKTYLRNTGISIIHASNGLEAVEKIRENPEISLILMDIRMPVLDGLQATKKIREMNIVIPIIAQTAYARPGVQNHLFEDFDDYLSKPISRESLLTLLGKYFPAS